MYLPENEKTIVNGGVVTSLRGIYDRISPYKFEPLTSCTELDLSGGSAPDMDFKLPDPMIGSALRSLILYGNKIGNFDTTNMALFTLIGQNLLALADIGANDFDNYNWDFNGTGITTFEIFRCNSAQFLTNASLQLETANSNSLRIIEIKDNPLLNSIGLTLNGAGLTNGTFKTINFSGNALNGQTLHALLTDWAACVTNDAISSVDVDLSGGTTEKLPLEITYSGGTFAQGQTAVGKDGGGSDVASGIILNTPAGSKFIVSQEDGDWSLAVTVNSGGGPGSISNLGAHPALATLSGASWSVAAN